MGTPVTWTLRLSPLELGCTERQTDHLRQSLQIHRPTVSRDLSPRTTRLSLSLLRWRHATTSATTTHRSTVI